MTNEFGEGFLHDYDQEFGEGFLELWGGIPDTTTANEFGEVFQGCHSHISRNPSPNSLFIQYGLSLVLFLQESLPTALGIPLQTL